MEAIAGKALAIEHDGYAARALKLEQDMQSFTETLAALRQGAPPLCLTRRTLLEIIRQAPENCRAGILENPQEFAVQAAQIIRACLAEQLIDGIRYEKLGEWYAMTQFEAEIESWQAYLEPAHKALYDGVIFDSQVERRFVQDLERMQEVQLYVKLPRWFTVPTPVGDYNPDWAIVWQPRDEHGQSTGAPLLYLVRETKGTHELDALRPDERRKLHCGRRHFQDALGVSFQLVTDASQLPGT